MIRAHFLKINLRSLVFVTRAKNPGMKLMNHNQSFLETLCNSSGLLEADLGSTSRVFGLLLSQDRVDLQVTEATFEEVARRWALGPELRTQGSLLLNVV